MRKSRPASRAGGRQRGTGMTTLAEGDEEPLVRNDIMTSQEKLDAPQRFSLFYPFTLRFLLLYGEYQSLKPPPLQ